MAVTDCFVALYGFLCIPLYCGVTLWFSVYRFVFQFILPSSYGNLFCLCVSTIFCLVALNDKLPFTCLFNRCQVVSRSTLLS